jgi:hypothetical protein
MQNSGTGTCEEIDFGFFRMSKMSRRPERIALSASNCDFLSVVPEAFSESVFFHTFQTGRFLVIFACGRPMGNLFLKGQLRLFSGMRGAARAAALLRFEAARCGSF